MGDRRWTKTQGRAVSVILCRVATEEISKERHITLKNKNKKTRHLLCCARRHALSVHSQEPQKPNSFWQPCWPQSKLFSKALNILSITLTHSVIRPKSVSLWSPRRAALRYQPPATSLCVFFRICPKAVFSVAGVSFFSPFPLLFFSFSLSPATQADGLPVSDCEGETECARYGGGASELMILGVLPWRRKKRRTTVAAWRCVTLCNCKHALCTFVCAPPLLPSLPPFLPPIPPTFQFHVHFQTRKRSVIPASVCVTLITWRDKTSLLDWQIHYIGPPYIRVGQTV